MDLKNRIRPLFNDVYLYNGPLTKFNNFFFGNSRTLGFHSILPENPFPTWHPNYSIVFTVNELEILIKTIKSNQGFISINDLVKSDFKSKSICLTFDDGYLDNLKYLLPILKKYNIPAVIYVCSSFIDGDYWNWWDNLGHIILYQTKITIKHSILKGSYYINDPKSKIIFFNLIKSHLIKMDKNIQIDFFKSNNLYYKPPKSPFMNWRQLKEIASEPLITIGSHTHSHISLKYFENLKIKDEISKCINILKTKLNQSSINHFALPYGHSFDNKFLYEIKNLFSLSSIMSTNPFLSDKLLTSRLLFSNK
tara:strand:+ start:1417 stop:2340 length:924 start_codon:yes stop_codon:yes gene_type:complete